jgi:hypothetical protein
MTTPLIHLYASRASEQVRATAECLADNLGKPVLLHDSPSALPAPDTRRPTRQQLRTERAELLRELSTARSLLALAEPHFRLAQELADIRVDIARYEQRLQQLDQALGLPQQEGQAA